MIVHYEKGRYFALPEKGFGRKAQAGLEQMILPYEVIREEDVFDATFLELPQGLFACAP